MRETTKWLSGGWSFCLGWRCGRMRGRLQGMPARPEERRGGVQSWDF